MCGWADAPPFAMLSIITDVLDILLPFQSPRLISPLLRTWLKCWVNSKRQSNWRRHDSPFAGCFGFSYNSTFSSSSFSSSSLCTEICLRRGRWELKKRDTTPQPEGNLHPKHLTVRHFLVCPPSSIHWWTKEVKWQGRRRRRRKENEKKNGLLPDRPLRLRCDNTIGKRDEKRHSVINGVRKNVFLLHVLVLSCLLCWPSLYHRVFFFPRFQVDVQRTFRQHISLPLKGVLFLFVLLFFF